MDLGNAAGDALFDLRIPLQMYECMMQGGRSRWPGQCNNPEEFAPDVTLAVTQVTIEVQRAEFGEYSRCNLCDNGNIPFAPSQGACPADSTCNCTSGEYVAQPFCCLAPSNSYSPAVQIRVLAKRCVEFASRRHESGGNFLCASSTTEHRKQAGFRNTQSLGDESSEPDKSSRHRHAMVLNPRRRRL
jgi:hypothetical protein